MKRDMHGWAQTTRHVWMAALGALIREPDGKLGGAIQLLDRSVRSQA